MLNRYRPVSVHVILSNLVEGHVGSGDQAVDRDNSLRQQRTERVLRWWLHVCGSVDALFAVPCLHIVMQVEQTGKVINSNGLLATANTSVQIKQSKT